MDIRGDDQKNNTREREREEKEEEEERETVFCFSPGLTEGFHQSGVAEAHWAVEKDEADANALKLNYLDSTVMTDDCNLILHYRNQGRARLGE